MEFGRKKKSNYQVSLIPMINIIFLLLIFFMVAGTVEGIDIFEVNLPKSQNGSGQSSRNAVIYLSTDGRIAVNNDIVDKKDLKTIISTLFIDNPKQKVTIKSDSEVAASKLVWLMNLVESEGGTEVALVTQGVSN